jgi:hypothetical protein
LLRFEWNDLQVYRPAHWILSGERLLTIWWSSQFGVVTSQAKTRTGSN